MRLASILFTLFCAWPTYANDRMPAVYFTENGYMFNIHVMDKSVRYPFETLRAAFAPIWKKRVPASQMLAHYYTDVFAMIDIGTEFKTESITVFPQQISRRSRVAPNQVLNLEIHVQVDGRVGMEEWARYIDSILEPALIPLADDPKVPFVEQRGRCEGLMRSSWRLRDFRKRSSNQKSA